MLFLFVSLARDNVQKDIIYQKICQHFLHKKITKFAINFIGMCESVNKDNIFVGVGEYNRKEVHSGFVNFFNFSC